MSFSKPRVRFSLDFAFTLQCHDTQFLWNFLGEALFAVDKKSPSVYNFSGFFECSNESLAIPHAIFETKRSGFIQVMHHSSVSWKITPQYFFSSNLIYFEQKSPSKRNFWTFEWWVNIHQIPHVIFETTSQFIILECHERWNFLWFGQKESIKV